MTGVTLSMVALLLVIGLAYSTVQGYTTWWFRRTGLVTVDGVPNGYLHRNSKRSAVIITRSDLSPKQSYLVDLSGSKFLLHCGEWHAPRVPAFPIGDLSSPCSIFNNGTDMVTADNPLFSTLVVRPNAVEFSTTQGRKVAASW